MTEEERESPQFPTLVIGLVVLIIGVAAYLTLVLTGHSQETKDLMAFLSPVVAAIFIVGYQQRKDQHTNARLTEQDQKLQVITEQTNGVLNKKIEDNTVKAFTERPEIADAMREHTREALGQILKDHL